MTKAYFFNDYYYINHFNKYITFNYKSKKRVKTKVINFLKKEHQQSEIIKFLNNYNLKLDLIAKSKKYLHFNILDKE